MFVSLSLFSDHGGNTESPRANMSLWTTFGQRIFIYFFIHEAFCLWTNSCPVSHFADRLAQTHTSVTFVDGRSEALVAMAADPCPSVNKQAGMNNCGDSSWQFQRTEPELVKWLKPVTVKWKNTLLHEVTMRGFVVTVRDDGRCGHTRLFGVCFWWKPVRGYWLRCCTCKNKQVIIVSTTAVVLPPPALRALPSLHLFIGWIFFLFLMFLPRLTCSVSSPTVTYWHECVTFWLHYCSALRSLH